MSHTYTRLYFHLTFHTRSEKIIRLEDLESLHNYIAGFFKKREIVPLAVGGVGDHIHAVLQISNSSFDFAKLVSELKPATNQWLKGRHIAYADFAWRRGMDCLQSHTINYHLR